MILCPPAEERIDNLIVATCGHRPDYASVFRDDLPDEDQVADEINNIFRAISPE